MPWAYSLAISKYMRRTSLFTGLAEAIALYTIWPLRGIHWQSEGRSRALLFMPLIGFVKACLLTILYFGLTAIYTALNCSQIPLLNNLYSFLITALLLFFTAGFSGFMHLDAYLDYHDARASKLEPKRQLEIMADPHLGAFAVIRLFFFLFTAATLLYSTVSLYNKIFFGLGAPTAEEVQLSKMLFLSCTLQNACLIATAYALAARLVYNLPKAKEHGLAHDFSQVQTKQHANSLVLMASFFVAVNGLLSYVNGRSFGRLLPALVLFSSYLIFLIIFGQFKERQLLRKFGGITGDLAGHYLCILEMISLVFCFAFALIFYLPQ